MSTETIQAVHDDDLRHVLESLGLLNKFESGKLTCAFCKVQISWENLHSFFADSGTIKFSCSTPNCINELVVRVQDLRSR